MTISQRQARNATNYFLDHPASCITTVPTTQRFPRIPLHVYRGYSYTKGDTGVTVTQRVPPAKKQKVSAVSDHQALQMQPIDYNTMTPSAYIIRGRNHLTARVLTWEDERVSLPGLRLNPKIDEGQSIQTSAEKWDQSKAKEINSLIQSGAVSPIHNEPMQIELNKRSRHIKQRFHMFRNNYNEADFFTRQLPTPQYEQTRREVEANEISVE
jgi:hypothetical protein